MQKEREILSRLTAEDFPTEELKAVASIAGVEATFKLLQMFAGQSIYFPKHWSKNFAPKFISEVWDGDNSRDICKTLGISRTKLFELLNDKAVKSKLTKRLAKERADQLDFFGGD